MNAVTGKVSIIAVFVGLLASPARAQLGNPGFEAENPPGQPTLDPWQVRGNVSIQALPSNNNAAVLLEAGSGGLSRITQTFDLNPANAPLFTFRYAMVHGQPGPAAAAKPPDAFLAFLVDSGGNRLVPSDPLAAPDFAQAFFYHDTNGPPIFSSTYVTVTPPDAEGFHHVALNLASLLPGGQLDDVRVEFGLATAANGVTSFVVLDDVGTACAPPFCCSLDGLVVNVMYDGFPCTIDTCNTDGTVTHVDADCCGDCFEAQADVVIMIDITPSISQDQLDEERDAAKVLLDRFAASDPRPRIAIGTFNACCTPDCDSDCGEDNARIVPYGGLSSDYGEDGNPGTNLYKAVNEIALGVATAQTDIASAINVAQDVFESSAVPVHNYIVIISDGLPNFPTGDCGQLPPCGCQASVDAADAAAAQAQAAGTKIVAVYFENPTICQQNQQCCNQGSGFMQNTLATDADAYFFEGEAGTGELACAFVQVADLIACDDLVSCTVDTCVLGVCQHDDSNCP